LNKYFRIIDRDGLTFLTIRHPDFWEGVEVYFTTRVGGVSTGPFAGCNLDPHGGDDADAVSANQRKVLAALGIQGLFLPRQVHGRGVLQVGKMGEGFIFGDDGDAAAGSQPGAAVGVMTADCLAVMLCAPPNPVVAAVHAGWRGIVRQIIPGALNFIQSLGGEIHRTRAYLGPAIGPCCYLVEPEVAGQVADASESEAVLPGEGGRFRVDLAAAAGRQLGDGGLPPESIAFSGLCTSCSPELFFSHRRDAGKTGRMAGIIVRRV
jgi:YfiH family protein